LAYETGVPIVPAYIGGTYQALPKGRNLPRKSRIQVIFGEPITLTSSQIREMDTMNEVYREIAEEVRSKIEALRACCE
jgi:1-acyl-sn-glycerol-3-phosphate acyltransferase